MHVPHVCAGSKQKRCACSGMSFFNTPFGAPYKFKKRMQSQRSDFGPLVASIVDNYTFVFPLKSDARHKSFTSGGSCAGVLRSPPFDT